MIQSQREVAIVLQLPPATPTYLHPHSFPVLQFSSSLRSNFNSSVAQLQETHCLLRNSKFHHRIYRRSPLDFALKQLNPVHSLHTVFNIYSNSIAPFTQLISSFRFSNSSTLCVLCIVPISF